MQQDSRSEQPSTKDHTMSNDTAHDQAVAQVASIYALVAALECDFKRLEELREARDAVVEDVRNASLDVDCVGQLLRETVGEDGEEHLRGRMEELDAARQALTDAQKALAEWNEENTEELEELEEAAGEWSDLDDVEQAIDEDPLSVEVRSGWADAGSELAPEEFRIVLCTGGPHVELLGDLDDNNEPDRVRVLYRGWGESGELYDFDHEAVLTYCRRFSFAP